ncbi:MAG TPA: VOC family protein [Planctomycetaceae bacterium]|nr:VOC family protein [Planctomycetaceae bacterium]
MSVRGIGGVFLVAQDPDGLAGWYARAFGLSFQCEAQERSHYVNFRLPQDPAFGRDEYEVLAIRPASAPLEGPRPILNLRVGDLTATLDRLAQAGIAVDRSADYDYGKFAWLTDPEGNPLELYEPL